MGVIRCVGIGTYITGHYRLLPVAMVTERGDREPCRAAETFFVSFPDRNLLYRHGYIFPLETTIGHFLYRIMDPAVTDPSRILFVLFGEL